MSTIAHSGWIVTDNEGVIWGTGASEDAAWADFLDEMSRGNVVVLKDGEEAPEDEPGHWTRAGNFTLVSASAALLADIAARGGNIAWGRRSGVACTIAQAEGGDA